MAQKPQLKKIRQRFLNVLVELSQHLNDHVIFRTRCSLAKCVVRYLSNSQTVNCQQ